MPTINEIDTLRSFVAIVDQGGLTAAVKTLGIPKSTLSRKLSALEAQVGARLIDRSAHGSRLTEAGGTVYRHAIRILSEVESLAEAIQPGEPSGLLRITTSYGLAVETLGPILPEFLKRFPKINIDLDASSQLRDLKRDDFDVALRVGPLSGGALIARRLGQTKIGLFAAPAYLAATGQTIDSIQSRPTIGLNRDGRRQYGPDGPETANKPHCRLRLNDPLLIKLHLVAGHGSGWLPIHMTRDDVEAGRLVHCKPDLSLDGGEIFVLFHGHKDLPAKTRVFVDFLVERLNLN